jgi:hypothetical protein
MTTIATPAGVSRRYSSTRLLLDKLEGNRSRNLELLSGAGCPTDTSAIRCDRCGISEPVHHWTPVCRRGTAVHLRCPSGCETRIRYDLGLDRVFRARDWLDLRPRAGLMTALAIGLAAMLLVGSVLERPSVRDEEVIGGTADTNQRSVSPFHTHAGGSGSVSGSPDDRPASASEGLSNPKAAGMIASRWIPTRPAEGGGVAVR